MNVRNKLARLFVLGTFLTGLVLTAACNTVEGVGRDVEALGDTIEDAADDAAN